MEATKEKKRVLCLPPAPIPCPLYGQNPGAKEMETEVLAGSNIFSGRDYHYPGSRYSGPQCPQPQRIKTKEIFITPKSPLSYPQKFIQDNIGQKGNTYA